LKPEVTVVSVSVHHDLSALDPGKQGLKPAGDTVTGGTSAFQRLIQENKD